MNRAWKWFPSLGASLFVTANLLASSPDSANVAPGTTAAPPAAAANADEQQLRPLLEELTELSRLIERDAQSPQLWQYHLRQSELLLRLALRSQGKERDSTLRMAVDSCASAALLCPREQPLAWQRLRELPARLAQAFPGDAVIFYAALQEIQTDCARMMETTGGDRAQSEGYRCQRLLRFAQEHREAPEAPKVVLQAARIYESLAQAEQASHCYQYLTEHFPGDAVARKAEGALWRLGPSRQPMQLELPLLYGPDDPSAQKRFNLEELRGKVVVVYFWVSTGAHVEDDFAILKQLTDRYAGRGLEVVYVNADEEPSQARTFLASRLTAGVHCYQSGGLDGPLAERYGLQELPQAFLVGRDGSLLRHSLPASRLEAELSGGPRRAQ